MAIEKVAGLRRALGDGIQGTRQRMETSEPNASSFADTLKGFLDDVNALQIDAGKSVERLMTGEINDIHEVMIAVEKAGVSFELLMEIRNKMIEAYQELMRMQV